MKVNETIFELDVVFSNMTQAITWDMLGTLRGVKKDLQIAKRILLGKHEEDEVSDINRQLFFLDKNIITLENALLCHESKQFEKRLSLEDLQLLCLN